MAEYYAFRCCMCPNESALGSAICPGIPNTTHPEPSPCRFVKVYRDSRGWEYFVRGGIGSLEFKTFYRKPGIRREHGWGPVPWRKTFDAAQADLNEQANKRGFSEV